MIANAYLAAVLRDYAELMLKPDIGLRVQVVAFGTMVNLYGLGACKQIDAREKGDRSALANAIAFDLAAEIIETEGI